MDMQRLLNKHGWNVGDPDGKIGNATRTAVKEAQIKFGLPADSYPTAELLERLGGASASNARTPEGPAPKPVKRAPSHEHRTQR